MHNFIVVDNSVDNLLISFDILQKCVMLLMEMLLVVKAIRKEF